MTKLVCDKHEGLDDQYFELESFPHNETLLICRFCYMTAAYEAHIEALKNTPGITVEKVIFDAIEEE